MELLFDFSDLCHLAICILQESKLNEQLFVTVSTRMIEREWELAFSDQKKWVGGKVPSDVCFYLYIYPLYIYIYTHISVSPGALGRVRLQTESVRSSGRDAR